MLFPTVINEQYSENLLSYKSVFRILMKIFAFANAKVVETRSNLPFSSRDN